MFGSGFPTDPKQRDLPQIFWDQSFTDPKQRDLPQIFWDQSFTFKRDILEMRKLLSDWKLDNFEGIMAIFAKQVLKWSAQIF